MTLHKKVKVYNLDPSWIMIMRRELRFILTKKIVTTSKRGFFWLEDNSNSAIWNDMKYL